MIICGTTAAAATDAPAGDISGLPRPDPETRRLVRDQIEQEAAAQAQRAEAVSGLPKSNLDPEQASQLLSTAFPEVAASSSLPLDNLDVVKYLGDGAAVVRAPVASASGVSRSSEAPTAPVLATSTIPLRTTEADGDKAPVDLGLAASGSTIEPTNPLVNVEIPRHLGQPIALPGPGVSVSLKGASPNVPARILSGSVAMFANVATDTDLAIAPLPGGFESFTQLRSPQSPTTQTFDLGLPSGTELRTTRDGGAEVVGEGSRRILTIHQPSARDAAGQSVPVGMEVHGDSITLKVSPSAQTAWPVLVDPFYEQYNWAAGQPGNPNDWRYSATENGFYTGYWSGYVTSNALFTGAQLYAYYPEYHGALWTYSVPRYDPALAPTDPLQPSTYITHLDFGGIDYSRNGDQSVNPLILTGIISPSANNYVGITVYTNDVSGGYLGVDPNVAGVDPTSAKQAWWGLYSFPGYGAPFLYGSHSLRLGAAVVYLADIDTPAWDPGFPQSVSTWVDNNPVSIPVSATDGGLGVRQFKTFGTNSSGAYVQIGQLTNNCTGYAASPCPRTWAPSQMTGWDPSVLPEGSNTLDVAADDVLGHETDKRQVLVNVDHSRPGLWLSGDLWEKDGQTIGPGPIDLDAYTGDELSGARSLTLAVDGASASSFASDCPSDGGCELDHTFTLTGSALAPGPHTISVTAADMVGRTTTQSIQVTVDTTAPETTIFSGPSSLNLSGEASISFASNDAFPTYECRLDSGIWEGCASPRQYGSLRNGAHSISVRATDAAGNTDPTPASVSFTVANPSPDTWIDSGPSGVVAASSASFSFSSNLPLLTYECRLDGGAWAACTTPKSYSSLTDGGHLFEVRSRDAAGRYDPTPASRAWTIDTAGPTIETDGDLRDTATTTGTALFVHAYDGSEDDLDTASAATRSGLSWIEVRFYPDPASSAYQTLLSEPILCEGAGTTCPPTTVNRSVEVPGATAQGTHAYEVRVTDQNGHTSVDRWQRTTLSDLRPVLPPLGYSFESTYPDLAAKFDRNKPSGDPKSIADELEQLKNGGGTWVYVPVNWFSAQRTQNQGFDFEVAARQINQARARGLKIVAALSGTPFWAAVPGDPDPDKNCPSALTSYAAGLRTDEAARNYCAPTADKTDDWAAFVEQVATQLEPDAIQIWNEPNSQTFSGGSRQYSEAGSREFYLGMPPSIYFDRIFAPAYDTLTAYNQAHPGAEIKLLAAGLAAQGRLVARSDTAPKIYPHNNYSAWLRRFIQLTRNSRAQPMRGFAIAQHLYPDPRNPSCPPPAYDTTPKSDSDCYMTTRAAVGDMAAIYRNVTRIANPKASPELQLGPVWATEVGLSTDRTAYNRFGVKPKTGDGLDPAQKPFRFSYPVQAQTLTRLYCQHIDPNTPMMVYKLIDNLPDDYAHKTGSVVASNSGFGTERFGYLALPTSPQKTLRVVSKPAYDDLQNVVNTNGGCASVVP